MKANLLTRKWLLVFAIVFLGVMEARADVQLTDDFSVTGLLRQELSVHTGEKNPNNSKTQVDRNTINLSRTFFHTEWTYKPNDAFKLFAKVKLISDQTEALDNKLGDYNAFPLATPRYGGYLRATNDNKFDAEMSELYADVGFGNLWLRLGKQQIVWGEMIAARILDQINPLDLSWHLQFEPEEFENIRVPQWSVRARYEVAQGAVPFMNDLYLEGFVNPGDISPTILPVYGSPFNPKPPAAGPPAPQYVTREIDRRGDMEYGFRIGGRVGQVAGTLNYFSLYSDSGYSEKTGTLKAAPPPPTIYSADLKYLRTDLYGASLNYAFPSPINIVVTYEGIYSPDEPYYVAASPTPLIRYNHTLKHAIQFSRSTFVLPQPISAMSIQLQYSQTRVWDEGKIKSTPAPYIPAMNNSIDNTQNTIALVLGQNLWHNNINLSLKLIYDLDDAHYIAPGFKYVYGNHWIFDIYGTILGGAEVRTNRFGSMSWAEEVFSRVTYQF